MTQDNTMRNAGIIGVSFILSLFIINAVVGPLYNVWAQSLQGKAELQKAEYTRQKVAELVDGGDISALWTDKSWDGEEQEWGTLYYEGRGDVDTEPNFDDSFQGFISSVNDSWCDYAYLFANGEWKCYTPKGNEEQIPA